MKSKVAGPTLGATAAHHGAGWLGRRSGRGVRSFGAVLVAAGMAAGSLTALGGVATPASASTHVAAASAAGNYGPMGPVPSVGTKVEGGTAYFAEGPSAAPTFIFPFVDAQDCTTVNFGQLFQLMYRPLYWYGNDNSPAIDYNYSVGKPPVFTDGNKTVTVTLNNYKWNDGEQVTSRDIEFWMNMMFAEKTHWCDYTPGYFPDNVVSVSYPNCLYFRAAPEAGVQPDLVHLQRAVADLPPAHRLGPHLAVGPRPQPDGQKPARHHGQRHRRRLQVPLRPGQEHRRLRQEPHLVGRRRPLGAEELHRHRSK